MSRVQIRSLVALTVLLISCGCNRNPYSESRSRPTVHQPPVHLPRSIDTQRAIGVIKYLSHDIGPRPQGSDNEYLAGNYVAESLRMAGCRVSTQSVELPGRRSSRNIIGFVEGRDGAQNSIVIGAHYDSKPQSPGANDNASGIAIVLELARLIPKHNMPFNLVFVGFGAEEIVDGNSDHHHYGSRQCVQSMSKQDLQKIIAMLSVDMVGAGTNLQIGNGSKRNLHVVNQLRLVAANMGVDAMYFKDWGSDHEAFEKVGVPVAHIRWYPYSHYHKPSDSVGKIHVGKLAITGSVILRWLESISASGMASMPDHSPMRTKCVSTTP